MQVAMKLAMIAAVLPPCALPMNNQFLRSCARVHNRKAWLFLGSDTGGKNHAVILSSLSTCRRHGVEPWAYLTDVISRMTDGSQQNLEELLPHKWKPRSSQGAPAEIPAFSPVPKNTLLDVDRWEAVTINVLQKAI